MYPRTNYEMTEAQLQELIAQCRPVPVMLIGGTTGPSQQENANLAWKALGSKMGFDSDTVRPIPGKGALFFSAVPSETEQQRADREAREAEEKTASEINRLTDEISERQERIRELTTEAP